MNDLTHQIGTDFERIAKNIHPGGWGIESERPLATLLGSCVAVCMFDPVIRIGGMNHFLLPSCRASDNAEVDIILNGDYSMEVLVNGMLNKGAKKIRLVAKVFGGGNILSSINTDIGGRNSAFAFEWLECEGITLASSDCNGPWSRKVVFVPRTGDAFCRRIPTSETIASQAAKKELEYARLLEKKMQPREKNIWLF